jgi:hypothetical protein
MLMSPRQTRYNKLHHKLHHHSNISDIPTYSTHIVFIFMALEALAAIGLVSSIVQFVDFASELLSKTNELRQSTTGADAENANLETTSQVLRRLSEGLCTTFDAITQEEKDIVLLANHCKNVVDEFLDILFELRKEPNSSKWRNFRQALRYIWTQDKLEKMSKRIDLLRNQLSLSLQSLVA